MKENKGKDAIIVVLVLALIFGGTFLVSELKGSKYKEVESFTEKQQAELKEINIDEYLELKGSSDTNVIYIARPTCSHCQSQTPRMKYIKYKYGVEINYLNTDNFSEDDYNKLTESDEFFTEEFGTPTILITKDNKIIDSIAGESEITDVVEKLKTNGLIEK